MPETIKIAITSKSFSKNQVLVQELKEKYPHAEVRLQLEPINLNEDQLIEFLADVELAIVGLDPITEKVLQACPKLKVVSKFGVGLNNIDQDACKKHNVKIGWTGGVNKLSVAEMALGFMLGLSRNLFTSSTKLNSGTWEKKGGFQLSEKTVGIIGVGHIGKEVIRLLTPFNCKILCNDIIDQDNFYQTQNVIKATKEEIYAQADLITLHTPLDPSTENLINLEAMNKFKKSPYLINTARGGIISEKDIVKGLNDGLISGVAIDAYISEPLDIEEIYSHPNIICTPHIGGNAKEAVMAMGRSAIQNLNPSLASL